MALRIIFILLYFPFVSCSQQNSNVDNPLKDSFEKEKWIDIIVTSENKLESFKLDKTNFDSTFIESSYPTFRESRINNLSILDVFLNSYLSSTTEEWLRNLYEGPIPDEVILEAKNRQDDEKFNIIFGATLSLGDDKLYYLYLEHVIPLNRPRSKKFILKRTKDGPLKIVNQSKLDDETRSIVQKIYSVDTEIILKILNKGKFEIKNSKTQKAYEYAVIERSGFNLNLDRLNFIQSQ